MKKIIYFLMVLISLSSCPGFAQTAMQLPVDGVALQIRTPKGPVFYSLEIAYLPDQTSAGTMYRTDLPTDRAMLFKFNDERVVSMWMANTPLPLDMIFIDKNGIIVSIVENTTPYSTNIISSKQPALFALEVNAGQATKHEMKAGQKVIHPSICGKCE